MPCGCNFCCLWSARSRGTSENGSSPRGPWDLLFGDLRTAIFLLYQVLGTSSEKKYVVTSRINMGENKTEKIFVLLSLLKKSSSEVCGSAIFHSWVLKAASCVGSAGPRGPTWPLALLVQKFHFHLPADLERLLSSPHTGRMQQMGPEGNGRDLVFHSRLWVLHDFVVFFWSCVYK